MKPGHVLGRSLVALVVVASPGFAGMLGQAVTGVPDLPAPATPVIGDEPVWRAIPTPSRASRSRGLSPGAAPRRAGEKATGNRGQSALNWAALRQCESSGDYTTDTGNGYYGAYQFDLRTWRSVGGHGNPAHATPAEQDRRAQLLYASRGSQPWPVCGRRLR